MILGKEKVMQRGDVVIFLDENRVPGLYKGDTIDYMIVDGYAGKPVKSLGPYVTVYRKDKNKL